MTSIPCEQDLVFLGLDHLRGTLESAMVQLPSHEASFDGGCHELRHYIGSLDLNLPRTSRSSQPKESKTRWQTVDGEIIYSNNVQENRVQESSRQELPISGMRDTMRCAVLNQSTQPFCLLASASERRIVVQKDKMIEHGGTRQGKTGQGSGITTLNMRC